MSFQHQNTMGKYTMRLSLVICLIVTVVLLVACTPHGQRRSAGTMLDDQTYETKAIDVLFSNPAFDTDDHIKVEAHSGTLLMAGETKSESNKALATELTSTLRGISRVVNELEVMPASSAADRLSNTYMTSKVNSVLAAKNPVAGFDATRIKVLTARNIVYLMGTVTQAEGEAVAEVVRNVGGVAKVVKVFDYTD